jgi:pSer/pThr/pTyr-binding forkhead associated (FHA) protein
MRGQIIKVNQRITLELLASIDDEQGQLIATLPAPDIEGYIIGRSDSASTYIPDVDLSQYDAKKRGVSRRHAVLLNYNNVVHVMDLDSMNGTFINGTRIIPYEPQALRNGDKLAFADLNIIILE